VDSVQLVFQQHAVLKANLDQPMDLFCGDMGVDLWNKKKWQGHLSKNMVIVCTAEVLRQCLHHSFITMEQINLLIFDEAHHAKKDHSYARIIKDFYAQQGPDELRPKIFGMTASPVDARVDVRKAAAELEALLHCQISTAADSSLLQYTVTSKQELLVKYAPLGPRFETPLYTQMHERFKSNLVLRKPLIFSLSATKFLGSWCADKVWEFCMDEEEVKKLLAKTERKYHSTKIQGPLEILEKQKTQIVEARAFVKSLAFDPPHFDPLSSTSSNLSTKVVELIKILRDRFQRPTEDKVIVFVEQRYTARILAKLFQHPNIGTKHLHVGTLVSNKTSAQSELV
jgi:endoribonuclease Dicer